MNEAETCSAEALPGRFADRLLAQTLDSRRMEAGVDYGELVIELAVRAIPVTAGE
ncbi:MAG TPA: hypothetical protein VHZ03_15990 [Trebonia sp.]|jgi:hypothetical protein|nr:hypothetical protein [Trebonia sp.]